eukprot:s236_g14.t3
MKISRLIKREQFEAMSERDRLLLLEFFWERKRRKRESKDVMRTDADCASSMSDESFQQGGHQDLANLASNEAMLPDTCGAAGKLLQLVYADLLLSMEQDFSRAARAAVHMELHVACEPVPDLVDYLHEVLEPGRGKNFKDWRCIMNKRIGLSYKAKNQGLVWLDDKVLQVAMTSDVLGDERHLPILSHGEQTREGRQVLHEAAMREVELNTPLVIKPRHGSNSKFVSMFPSPMEDGLEAVLESVDLALDGDDPSWKKESWNQNAVPRGALLQPLYTLMADFAPGVRKKLMKPLELKVQVLFGVVVGGCLNSHPMALWVSSRGAVQLWDPNLPGLLKKGHGFWEPLPDEALEVLLRSLSESWEAIRRDSELLAQRVGLDELRVDWLLGDRFWGPRIGELTYMGTFALDLWPVSWRLARAFAAGHLRRWRDYVAHAGPYLSCLPSDGASEILTFEEDRRLKLGEIVEARSWMKKHEESGLTRIRCRATSDGAVGWATVVGNQGTVFLEAK